MWLERGYLISERATRLIVVLLIKNLLCHADIQGNISVNIFMKLIQFINEDGIRKRGGGGREGRKDRREKIASLGF